MDKCSECKSLKECEKLNIPKAVVARVIDLMHAEHDEMLIESMIINELNYPINSKASSVGELIGHLRNVEKDCIENRDVEYLL